MYNFKLSFPQKKKKKKKKKKKGGGLFATGG